MDSSIIAIANHKLVTTGIAALAADVAARLKARVVYGTENDFADFVPAGEAGQGERTLRLCDLREPGDGPEIVVYELFDVPGTGNYSIWIFSDCFRAGATYLSGSFGLFCGAFTGKHAGWEEIMQYRRDVHAEATLLGGDTAIYYEEEGKADFVGYDAEDMPFAAVLASVQALGTKTLHIDQWLRLFKGAYERRDPHAFLDKFEYWQLPAAQ